MRKSMGWNANRCRLILLVIDGIKLQTTATVTFFHIDMERYTLEAVLKKGAELVKRKGIKCLVIDPFNKVRSNDASGDVNVYTLEYLQQIEIFAKKYDVLVIVVAHPTKMYKDAQGRIEEPTYV
jgi:twinkle protein